MTAPRGEQINATLCQLEVELEAYAGGEVLYESLEERAWSIATYSLAETIYSDFEYANRIANSPANALQTLGPVFELTQRAMETAASDNRIEAVGAYMEMLEDGCLEAEPRLARSLNRHARPRPNTNDYPVAVVLYDTQGEPYAYQKTSGHQTAYAWRSAQVPTQDGEKYVPGDSFLKVNFGESEPREAYRGDRLGLVALTSQLFIPQTIELVRFSRNVLPEDVRRFISHEDFWRVHLADNSPYFPFKHREFRLQTAAEIGRRIHRMLAAGKAIAA